jgi:hypothetical protein
VPDVVIRTIVRWFFRAVRTVRRAWDESQAAQEALVEINTPWRHDGELRWRRGSRGWELHGDRLASVPIVPRER